MALAFRDKETHEGRDVEGGQKSVMTRTATAEAESQQESQSFEMEGRSWTHSSNGKA